MTAAGSALLGAAGTISLAIGLLQFVMYFGGPSVYWICGTPEVLITFRLSKPVAAVLAEILLTILFFTFAAYGYSGAGLIGSLPRLASGLVVIAAIYLGRGLFVIPQVMGKLERSSGLDLLYSCSAIAVGVAYALPTYWSWEDLRAMGSESG